jgi:hypothetical protein
MFDKEKIIANSPKTVASFPGRPLAKKIRRGRPGKTYHASVAGTEPHLLKQCS